MLTQCPHCNAIFRLRVEQVRIANGQVLCGRCHTPFDALANLYSPRQAESPERIEAIRRAAGGEGVEELSEADQLHDWGGGEEEAIPPAWTSALFDQEQLEEADREEVRAVQGKGEGPVDEVIEAASRLLEPQTDNAALASAMAEAAGQRGHDYTLPLNREEVGGRSPVATLFWGIGAVGLLALLLAQYLHFNHHLFAQDPYLRPHLEQLCAFTGCRLEPLRDLSAIQLEGHNVVSHPDYRDTLLVQATLINHAPFAQPYPELELEMTDLNQQVVAHRRFTPAEYLVQPRGDGLIHSGERAEIRLELTDPGKEAVGFEFNFY